MEAPEVTAFQIGKLFKRIRACWAKQPCFISTTPRNSIKYSVYHRGLDPVRHYTLLFV